MTDIQDLKAIAERCKAHQPLRFMRSHGALYIRNDNGIVFDVHQNRSFPEFMAQNKDYADLVLAANPAAVLELIAEIERITRENQRLRAGVESDLAEIDRIQGVYDAHFRKTRSYRMQRDQAKDESEQLKAEKEALRKDAERYRWLRTETGSGPNIQVSEWVGPHEYRLFTEELDAAIDNALSEESSHG
jgi:hypothetical protein